MFLRVVYVVCSLSYYREGRVEGEEDIVRGRVGKGKLRIRGDLRR